MRPTKFFGTFIQTDHPISTNVSINKKKTKKKTREKEVTLFIIYEIVKITTNLSRSSDYFYLLITEMNQDDPVVDMYIIGSVHQK